MKIKNLALDSEQDLQRRKKYGLKIPQKNFIVQIKITMTFHLTPVKKAKLTPTNSYRFFPSIIIDFPCL